MSWRIEGFIWLDWVVEKISRKHGVNTEEVEEVFFNTPYKLRRTRDDKYQWFGHSDAGRYLVIIFIWEGRHVKIITARDMDAAERRFYTQK